MVLTLLPEEPDVVWGLLPESEGWQKWFAWRPVKACGRWRWLYVIQRRRYEAPVQRTIYDRPWEWQYSAGYAHDYPDGVDNAPLHFHTHECKHCSAKFTI